MGWVGVAGWRGNCFFVVVVFVVVGCCFGVFLGGGVLFCFFLGLAFCSFHQPCDGAPWTQKSRSPFAEDPELSSYKESLLFKPPVR